MQNDYENRLCGFCGLSHLVFTRKNIGLRHVLWIALVSLVTTYLIWEALDPKGLVVFSGWIFISELTIVTRRALSLPCPHCGFDPVLYFKNKPRAVEKIKKTIDARKNDPKVWFAQKPPLKLPYRKVAPQRTVPAPETVA